MSIDSSHNTHVLQVTDGSIRSIFYGRYSSDNQRDSSIEDQFRNCRELASKKGWVALEQYNQSDEEKTGRTQFGQPGLKALMAIAKAKPRLIDYVVIDDTSRFGRNAAETLQLAKILHFNGVSLYFVEDGLDSRDPSFWENYARKALDDERQSRGIAAKVKRGRIGRFLNGYNPGGGCYGYRNVPEEDYTRKGAYGRPAVNGVRQEKNPATSKIVLRIFQSYAEGMSYREIAVMLNREGIPTSQGPRSKRKSTWSKNAIHSILENSRYIGKLTWGTTREELDPETGQRKRFPVPQSEWQFREFPELRIVSDELWEMVQLKRKEKVSGGVQKNGGMSRTEASRRYLLSSLMKCGMCGGNILVTTTSPTRYGCSTHRYRGTCTNKTTIRQDQLGRAFVSALSENLRSDDLRGELVQALHKYLLKMEDQKTEAMKSVEAQKDELESNRAALLRHQANLLKAIRESGGCRALYEDLKEVEGKISRIDEILTAPAVQTPTREIRVEEVRAFVENEVNQFQELLLSAPEKVKAEFQRRITSITLTPDVDKHGPIYRVAGDVDLFSVPAGALQTNQVDLIGLQYTIPITFGIVPYRSRLKWALPQAA
jgi:DNA invertase Pin-like site-specific DNA recombinase